MEKKIKVFNPVELLSYDIVLRIIELIKTLIKKKGEFRIKHVGMP